MPARETTEPNGCERHDVGGLQLRVVLRTAAGSRGSELISARPASEDGSTVAERRTRSCAVRCSGRPGCRRCEVHLPARRHGHSDVAAEDDRVARGRWCRAVSGSGVGSSVGDGSGVGSSVAPVDGSVGAGSVLSTGAGSSTPDPCGAEAVVSTFESSPPPSSIPTRPPSTPTATTPPTISAIVRFLPDLLYPPAGGGAPAWSRSPGRRVHRVRRRTPSAPAAASTGAVGAAGGTGWAAAGGGGTVAAGGGTGAAAGAAGGGAAGAAGCAPPGPAGSAVGSTGGVLRGRGSLVTHAAPPVEGEPMCRRAWREVERTEVPHTMQNEELVSSMFSHSGQKVSTNVVACPRSRRPWRRPRPRPRAVRPGASSGS